jgi:hypothetical protein
MSPEQRAAQIASLEAAAKLREDLVEAKPKHPKNDELLKLAKQLREEAERLRVEGREPLTDTQGSA